MNALGHGAGVGDGQAGVDGVDGGGGRREESVFALRGAEEDSEEVLGRIWLLGEVHRGARGSVELTFLNIVDDGDDLHGLLTPSVGDLLADGILAREILRRAIC